MYYFSQAAAIQTGAHIAKLAAKKKHELSVEADTGLGVAGLGAAALAAKPTKEYVTGRKILYHGTTPEMAAKAREGGLRPSSQTGSEGITRMVLGDEVASKPLVYATPSKTQAHYYQNQSQAIADGGAEGLEKFRQNPAGEPHTRGVLRMEIPHGSAKYVQNPETAEGLGAFLKKNPGATASDFRGLNNATKTIEDGVASQHIVGGRGFKRVGLKEIGAYAKKYPKRFAGGAALGVAGIGAGLYGAKKIYNAQQRWKRRQ